MDRKIIPVEVTFSQKNIFCTVVRKSFSLYHSHISYLKLSLLTYQATTLLNSFKIKRFGYHSRRECMNKQLGIIFFIFP